MEKTPDLTEYLKLGQLLQLTGKIEKALAVFEQVMVKFPTDYRPFYNAAFCCVMLNRHDDALARFDDALSLNPSLLEAYGGKSKVLLTMRRAQDAVAVCRSALAIDPLDSICLSNINVAMRMLGDMSAAIELSWQTM